MKEGKLIISYKIDPFLKVVMTNSQGNTFTLKSEGLADFLSYECKELSDLRKQLKELTEWKQIMTVDTNKLVDILKNDQPLNVTLVEEYGEDKLIVLFALPELLPQIEAFAKQLLKDYQKEK